MGIKAFSVCLFILIFSQTYAQQPNIGVISGVVKDSTTKKALSLATVSVFKLTDSSIVSFKLCDDKGSFEIRNIPINQTLKIVTTFEGYEVDRREVRLTASANYPIGPILLKPTSKSLDEVIVKSERPPIIVKKDTIEFNATAFKTLPNALVEDLFKKLPGMQVDRDGNITYNGRPVSRIYVDGKSFFNDNYKAATQILPSAIVANVQVYDDKEQLDATQKNTDYNKIINLKLKQNVKKSTFGKLSSSGGTDNRYELAGAVNFLRDTVQLTLIGYKNNLNRGIFNSSEMRALGAFNRSQYKMSFNGDRNSYTFNDISFGGGVTAETESTGGGINFNHAPTKNTSFYTQYFVSHEDGYTNEHAKTLFYNNDTINEYKIKNQFASIKTVQNLNFGLKSKSKSGNRNLTLNVGNQWSAINSTTLNTTINSNDKVGEILNSNGKLDQSIDPKNYYHALYFFSRLFEKNDKYKAITFQQSYNLSQDATNFLTEIDNLSLIPTPTTSIIRQLRIFNPRNQNIINRLVLSGWSAKKFQFVLASNLDINNEKNSIFTYLRPVGNNNYDSIDANLTSDISVANSIFKVTPEFDFEIKKYTLSIRATYFNAHQKLNISNRLFDNNNIYTYPLLGVSFYKSRGIRLSFDQKVNLPRARDLTPIIDNTNPLFVFNGNVNLRAEKATTFSISYRKFNVKQQVNFNSELYYEGTQNPIIQSVRILNNGKQEIQSMNAGNRHSLVMRLLISKSFQKINRYNHSINLNLSYQNIVTPAVFNETEFSQKVNVFKTIVGNSFNWQDKFGIYYSYSYTANVNRFTNNFTADVLSNVQNLDVEVTARLFKKVSFNTTLLANKIVYENLPALPVNLFINPSVSVYCLKENKGEIKFIVRDLLNRNNNFSRNVIGNNITETNTNVLGRYFLLTFSYNFKTFKNEQNNKVNW